MSQQHGNFRARVRQLVGTAEALEIGASYCPLLPKRDGFRVTTVDHLPAEELKAKYAPLGTVVEAIEPVDYVWQQGPLRRIFTA